MLHRDPSKLFPHDYLMRYTFVPLVPKWVTPNMITIFRILLIPFVLWFLFLNNYNVGVPLFLFAAFTDALDGSVARLRHQVTEWGTFYDPLADKLLVGSVVVLVVIQHMNPILGSLILFIDLVIMVGGFIRKRQGKPMGSNLFGKTKMFFQVLGISLLLTSLWAGYDLFIPFSFGTFALAIILAVISLFTYGM
ncbi:MAG: CDP-alcohol phosphatidyltransferase family protein [Candidatus Uhrbacteria bacterium]|nr:CDP-alcohol phosphatidyltransferase family protein [Candidatus Uhrbacteria bacterium]